MNVYFERLLPILAYLQSGLLKCPLLKMIPLNGALNSMSTTIPALEHWTSMRLIVGIIMATAVVSAKIWAGTIATVAINEKSNILAIVKFLAGDLRR